MYRQAQNVQLTLDTLEQFNVLDETRDVQGQDYLFQGPGVDDLRILRQLNPRKIHELENLIVEMFNIIGENLQDDLDYEPSDDEIEYEIGSLVEMYTQDFEFKNQKTDDWEAFLKYLSEERLADLIVAALQEKYASRPPNQWPEFQEIYDQLRTYRLAFRKAHIRVPSSLKALLTSYRRARMYPNDEYKWEQFYKELATQSAPILQTILSNNDQVSIYRKPIPQEYPKWLPQKRMQSAAESHWFDSELTEWYEDYNKGDLRSSASESLIESAYYQFSSEKSSMKHRFGFDAFETLIPKRRWDSYRRTFIADSLDPRDPNDPRRHIPVSTISDLINHLFENIPMAKSVRATVPLVAMYLYAIKELINSDPVMKTVFSNDVNRMQIDPDRILDGISKAHELGTVPVPSMYQNQRWQALLQEQIQQREAAEAAHREQLRAELEAQRAAEESHHVMLLC